MKEKEISAALGWSIRHHKGFYCNGKKFLGITYHKDGTVDLNNYDEDCYIVNAVVESIESIKVNGELAKNLIISQGELI